MIIHFYVGSYAPEGAPGIALCAFDTGKQTARVQRTFTGVKDPIYLALHPELPVLYSCADTESGAGAAAWRIGEDGALTLAGLLSDGGKGCCHVSVDPEGAYLSLSNYGDGSLSIARIEGDGTVLTLTDRVQHHGRSAHWKRQNEAHVHFSTFEGDDILSCDLGEDRIYRYRLDRRTGTIREAGTQYRLSPGDGPRHLVTDSAHGRIYCITEMGSNVSVFDAQTGKKLQRLHSIPEDVDLRRLKVGDYDAFGAAIRRTADGTRILASNRGHDSISVFAVREGGYLTRLSTTKTGGVMPRDFAIVQAEDAAFVLVANQESGGVTILRFDADRTALTDTGIRIPLAHPVAVLPVSL